MAADPVDLRRSGARTRRRGQRRLAGRGTAPRRVASGRDLADSRRARRLRRVAVGGCRRPPRAGLRPPPRPARRPPGAVGGPPLPAPPRPPPPPPPPAPPRGPP